MNIKDFLQKTKLDNTALVGFYGGGNYGDELLLEVLSMTLAKQKAKNITVAYQTIPTFKTFHNDYGYSLVNMKSKEFVLSLIRSKNIIIGGGGLWGLDVSINIFFLSALLFICRWLFGKKVYLVGVGYYGSTGTRGHISAFLAGKAATTIFARDKETYANFSKLNKHTVLDRDIAWHIDFDTLDPAYNDDAVKLEQQLSITQKTILVTLRRFPDWYKHNYNDVIEQLVKRNPDRKFIIMLMEPRHVDPDNFKLITKWANDYDNIQISDFNFNPIALFLFMKKYSDKLVYIGPQFHGIITAFTNNVPFFPVVYDNKVEQLIMQITPNNEIVHIKDITYEKVMQFIEKEKS